MVQFANPPSTGRGDQSSDDKESVTSGQLPFGILKRKSEDGEGSKKRKRKRSAKANGHHDSRRRMSVSKPARDPRDDPSPPRPTQEAPSTRSPSPVIDFDGLSRPSRLTRSFSESQLLIVSTRQRDPRAPRGDARTGYCPTRKALRRSSYDPRMYR